MTPSVSVVIVPGNQRERATRSLASVLEQEGIERAEVVLLDAAGLGPPLPSAPAELDERCGEGGPPAVVAARRPVDLAAATGDLVVFNQSIAAARLQVDADDVAGAQP